MIMERYTTEFDREEYACARVEDANVSYKDLTQVCGRIRGKNADWAVEFLAKVAEGKAAVLYKQHCKRMGHRKELGGKKGRYPRKASAAVLKVLKSAMANGRVKGLGEAYEIVNAAANRRYQYGRVASKGRWARSDYETARIEIVLKPLESVPKGVEIKLPKKAEKKEEKPKEKKEEKPKAEPKKAEKPREIKKEEKPKAEPEKEEPKKAEEKPKEVPKKVEEKKPEAHKHESHHGNPEHEHGKGKHETHEHEAKKEEPKKAEEKKPEAKAEEKKPEPKKEEKKSDVK